MVSLGSATVPRTPSVRFTQMTGPPGAPLSTTPPAAIEGDFQPIDEAVAVGVPRHQAQHRRKMSSVTLIRCLSARSASSLMISSCSSDEAAGTPGTHSGKRVLGLRPGRPWGAET